MGWFFALAPCMAQPPTEVNFNHLTIDNGLSQSVPTGILKDSKGFVWITTYNGVNKFDGITCLKNDQIAKGLTNISLVLNPIEDRYGNIWMNSNRELIQYSYTKNLFTKFSINNSTERQTNNSKESEIVFYDNNNTFIIHNEVKKELWAYHILNNTYRSIPYPVVPKALKFISHRNSNAVTGNIAGVHQTKDSLQIYQLELKDNMFTWQKESIVISPAITITNGVIDKQKILWFTTNKGLLQYKNNRLNLFEHFNTAAIQKLRNVFIGGNNLWLSSYNNGVYCFDLTTEKFVTNYYHNPAKSKSIAANYVWNIYVDNTNVLWACVFGRGVDYCELKEPAVFHHYTKEQAFLDNSDNYIRGIYRDANNHYWCTTLNAGIICLDSNFNALQTPAGFKNYDPTALGLHNQQLYFGIHDLKIFDIKKQQLYSIGFPPWSITDNYIEQLTFAKDSSVLLATKKGIWCYKKGNRHLDTLNGLHNNKNWVMYVFEDSGGNIYEAVSFGGVSIYKKVNGVYRKICSNTEPFTVRSIYETKNNKVWIGTTNGLYSYDKTANEIKRVLSTSNGLADNIVYSIAEDESGALWISTNNGINKILQNGKVEMHLTKRDGLQSLEFNTNTVCKTKNGHILFGGTNGINELRTANFNFSKNPINVVITCLKADSVINPFKFTGAENEKLVLGAGTHTFEISFLALDIIFPERHKLKYRLSGFEDDWIETGNSTAVRYTKVPPGKYTFEIAAAGSAGKTIQSLIVQINNYWWQTMLFKIVTAVFVLASLILLVKNYIHTKLERQRMAAQKQQAVYEDRERIAKDLHDNISANISSINILSGVMKHKLKGVDAETGNIITLIGNSAAEVLADIKDTIWFINPAHQDFNFITERLRQFAEPLCSDLNIGFSISFFETDMLNNFTQLEKKSIFMICKEAIHNSIKYAQAKSINVSINKEANNLIIKIKDDGIGIQNKSGTGNGLRNMTTRAESMRGTICWIHDNGTVVTVSIPLREV